MNLKDFLASDAFVMWQAESIRKHQESAEKQYHVCTRPASTPVLRPSSVGLSAAGGCLAQEDCSQGRQRLADCAADL